MASGIQPWNYRVRPSYSVRRCRPVTNQLLAVGPDVQFQDTASEYVQVGQNFEFTVTFQKHWHRRRAIGPFVDLIFPDVRNSNGIDFVSATYLGQPLNVIELVFPDDGDGTGTISHPFAVDETGSPFQITGAAGDKLGGSGTTIRRPLPPVNHLWTS